MEDIDWECKASQKFLGLRQKPKMCLRECTASSSWKDEKRSPSNKEKSQNPEQIVLECEKEINSN
jgi:hypothetical protein